MIFHFIGLCLLFFTGLHPNSTFFFPWHTDILYLVIAQKHFIATTFWNIGPICVSFYETQTIASTNVGVVENHPFQTHFSIAAPTAMEVVLMGKKGCDGTWQGTDELLPSAAIVC